MAEAGGPELEELLEQIRRLSVTDVLVSTVSTLAQVAYAKLEPDTRDLAHARLAVEGIRALLPVLEGSVPPGTTRDLAQLLANLQLAYADAAAGPAPPPAGDDG